MSPKNFFYASIPSCAVSKKTKESQESIVFTSNEKKREVRKNGKIVHLTNAEFEIMHYLIKRSGFAVSREEILTNIESIKL
nr:hypothetical protein [Nitratiruptor tergarcus]